MSKAKLNYWVDMATGLAFVLSAVSGIVFLLPSSLANGQLHILSVSYQAWNQLHTWSSLVMVAGALLHVALHWQWVVSMTKKTLRPAASVPTAVGQPGVSTLTRRRLLQLGGLGLASGIAFVGFRALADATATPAAADDTPDPLPCGAGRSGQGRDAQQRHRPSKSSRSCPTNAAAGRIDNSAADNPAERADSSPTDQATGRINYRTVNMPGLPKKNLV